MQFKFKTFPRAKFQVKIKILRNHRLYIYISMCPEYLLFFSLQIVLASAVSACDGSSQGRPYILEGRAQWEADESRPIPDKLCTFGQFN